MASYNAIAATSRAILGLLKNAYHPRGELVFQGKLTAPNFLWQAVRAFFSEGGKQLYISRVFRQGTNDDGRGAWSSAEKGPAWRSRPAFLVPTATS